jgi:hypothetical protein
MTMWVNALLMSLAGALAAGVSSPANAALVTLSSSCTIDCATIGQNVGDAVSAQFTVNAGPSFANLSLAKSAVTDFAVYFGNVDFGIDDLPTNWDFRLQTNAAGVVTLFQFLGSFGSPTSLAFATTGDSVDLRHDVWFAARHGTCVSTGPQARPCDFSVTNIFGAYDPAATSNRTTDAVDVRIGAATVPEPSTLALLGATLAGLAVTRRRKAAVAAAATERR